METRCPICGSARFGKIGPSRHFCPHCCHEVVMTTKSCKAYYPGEDGDLRLAGSVKEVARCYAMNHAI